MVMWYVKVLYVCMQRYVCVCVDDLGYQLRPLIIVAPLRLPCILLKVLIRPVFDSTSTTTTRSFLTPSTRPPPHLLTPHPANDMPALFVRSFYSTSHAAGVPNSTPVFSLALPTSWFRRIAASLRPTHKHKARRSNTDSEKSAAGDRVDSRHRNNTFLSQPR